MSVIRPKPPEDPIEYRAEAGFAPDGTPRENPDGLEAWLGRARTNLLGTADVELPDRLLDEYNTGGGRADSRLFAILQVARRIRDTVDRVIVFGDGCGPLGARAVFESCAHPCHNELSRGERGGRPRLSFLGPGLDNDGLQGLLDLVAPAGKPRGGDLLDQWAIVVMSRTGGGPEMAAATRLLLAALRESAGGDRTTLADRMVPITEAVGRLASLAAAVGCADVFTIPADIGDGALVFTAPGLLPAAIAGIDVVRLLQGAAAMNRRFREAPLAENPVLQFAGLSRRMAERHGMARVLASRSGQLDALGRWHERLAARQATPLVTDLIVKEPRRDPLVVPMLATCPENADGLDDLATTPWPDLLAAAREADAATRRPADAIVLPRIDEHSIGQLLQLLVLTNLIESHP